MVKRRRAADALEVSHKRQRYSADDIGGEYFSQHTAKHSLSKEPSSPESEVSSTVSETSEDSSFDGGAEIVVRSVEHPLPLPGSQLIQDSSAPSRLTAQTYRCLQAGTHVKQVLSEAQALESRLASFIPRLQQSNQDLHSKSTSDLNIEDISDHDEPHIEMDLGLGVLEHKSDQSNAHNSPAITTRSSVRLNSNDRHAHLQKSHDIDQDNNDEDDDEDDEDDCDHDDDDRHYDADLDDPAHSYQSPAAATTPVVYGIRKPSSELGEFDDEPDVMRHLLGLNRPRLHPGIEELEGLKAAYEAQYPSRRSSSVSAK